MPEEAIGTGKVRSLGMTRRVEDVPLPPSLTQSEPRGKGCGAKLSSLDASNPRCSIGKERNILMLGIIWKMFS